jgi:cytochrome c oxidase assembly factor CtaG
LVARGSTLAGRAAVAAMVDASVPFSLPCDVLSGLLVFSDRVAYPMYFSMPQQSGFSVIEDQQCAGALMWTCVTVVFLVAGTILSMQLLSPDFRPTEALPETLQQ